MATSGNSSSCAYPCLCVYFFFDCSFAFRDSVKFSKIIHKALPVVAMLLGSKQSTDILEAIDFFVSAFEFGVQNSMLGVRRMLSLIWSGEATIREAVVAAYKRLYIEVCVSAILNNNFNMTNCFLKLTSPGSGPKGRRAHGSSSHSSELFSSCVRSYSW